MYALRSSTVHQESQEALRRLTWFIDKFHFGCSNISLVEPHHACRDPFHKFHDKDVDPYHYSELQGIDTVAAKQVFSVVET